VIKEEDSQLDVDAVKL